MNEDFKSETFELLLMLSVATTVAEEVSGYEKQYQMTSADFMVKFNDGALPENVEFFQWRTAYTGLKHVIKQICQQANVI